jgi:hypothetical protein
MDHVMRGQPAIKQLGVRIALGAERMHVRCLVMREVLVLVATVSASARP